jgi:hypothetical protein
MSTLSDDVLFLIFIYIHEPRHPFCCHRRNRAAGKPGMERRESQAWRGGKAIFAHHFVCRSIPAEPNEEDYAVMMELEVEEEVLEIEVDRC